jgi:hypothetical protein
LPDLLPPHSASNFLEMALDLPEFPRSLLLPPTLVVPQGSQN